MSGRLQLGCLSPGSCSSGWVERKESLTLTSFQAPRHFTPGYSSLAFGGDPNRCNLLLSHLSSLIPAVAPKNVGVSWCWVCGIKASASSRQPFRLSPACVGSEV